MEELQYLPVLVGKCKNMFSFLSPGIFDMLHSNIKLVFGNIDTSWMEVIFWLQYVNRSWLYRCQDRIKSVIVMINTCNQIICCMLKVLYIILFTCTFIVNIKFYLFLFLVYQQWHPVILDGIHSKIVRIDIFSDKQIICSQLLVCFCKEVPNAIIQKNRFPY